MRKKGKASGAKGTEKEKGKAPRRRAKTPAVVLAGERMGSKLKVTASHEGQVIYFDTINHDLAPQRERFIRGVVKRLPGVEPATLEADLMKLPATLPALPKAEQEGEPEAEVAAEKSTAAVKVVLTYRPDANNRQGTLTADRDGVVVHLDNIDPSSSTRRRRFIKDLLAMVPDLDTTDAETQLVSIADQETNRLPNAATPNGSAEAGSGGKPSQADLLVELAGSAELFHTPGGHDSEGYATVEVKGHRETWTVSGKGFKRWLGKLFYDRFQKAPGCQAVQDALTVIAGKAIHDGPEHEIAVRIAEHDGAIYLDLADEQWRAVRIMVGGWTVVSDPPVKFVRKRGMLALPEPVQGGRLDELRALVNLPDADGWMLFVAWLVAALRPNRPFPILAVNGEQGSAKSTLCKMARALIDPNLAPLRRPPREDRDLLIAATNGWIVGFDNLSGIAPALSDALCLLATGGGFGTRELYTDDEEKLFDAMRPIMLNGIEDLATRADLLDRALCLTLPMIPDDQRRDEADLWKQFEDARPRLLGALLGAVSAALRNLPNTRLASKPRMADFALWIVAAEPALGWKPGAFLAAYNENRGQANEQALDSAIIASPILALLGRCGQWSGTARELLDELETDHADEKTKKRKDWPTGPRKLAGDVRRLAPNLRRAGIGVTFDRDPGKERRRLIRLEQIGKTPSAPSATVQAGSSASDGRTMTDGTDGTFPSESSVEEIVEWTA